MFKIVRMICVGGVLSLEVISANAETFEQKYGKMISDDVARAAIRVALTKIDKATCEANKLCSPANADEFSRPPIAIEDGRAAMVFAIRSALAQWCGLDWKRNFLPMIAYGKGQKKMNDRQLQLMSLIHGEFQGRQLATYTKSGSCPANMRTQLDAQLPKLNR